MTKSEFEELADTLSDGLGFPNTPSIKQMRLLREIIEVAYFNKLAFEAQVEMQKEDWPTEIQCPICEQLSTVYHFQWEAKTCGSCKGMISRSQWKLHQEYDPLALPI